MALNSPTQVPVSLAGACIFRCCGRLKTHAVLQPSNSIGDLVAARTSSASGLVFHRTFFTFSAAASSGCVRRRHSRHLTCAAHGTTENIAVQFKCVLLDCDGVLWQGGYPIPGSAEAVAAMRSSGIQVRFVTNASSRARAEVAVRIAQALGMQVDAEEVVTSSSTAAAEVAALGVSHVFVVGEHGLREELRLAGVQAVLENPPEPFDECKFRSWANSLPSVGAVIVGHDEAFSYSKLAAASMLLQRGGDACVFIGTNPDTGNRDVAGYLVPEAGSIIAAVEAASGRKAAVVGKPQPDVILQLLKSQGLTPESVLMIGDRLDTDIQFGVNAGVKTCLVLTGVSSEADVQDLRPPAACPDFVRRNLAAVVASPQPDSHHP